MSCGGAPPAAGLSPFSLLVLLLFTHCSKIVFLASSHLHIRGTCSLRTIPLLVRRHLTKTSVPVAFIQSAIGSQRNDSISECVRKHRLSSTRRLFRGFERMMSTIEAAEGSVIKRNLQEVRRRIQSTMEQCNRVEENIRLVAVSKTKPASMVVEAYEEGQRCFGENYAQEMISKAEELNDKHPGIEWHFIGPLQSNKASSLVKHVGQNLKCIETVSTLKLAQKLDRAVEDLIKSQRCNDTYRLCIFLQIDTSGEETKSGVDALHAPSLAAEIVSKCPHLSVEGVMTIGAPGDFNCFDALVDCRNNVAKALSCPPESLELSMGMSGDFEEAIRRGATNVRVGSTIFGERDYSKK